MHQPTTLDASARHETETDGSKEMWRAVIRRAAEDLTLSPGYNRVDEWVALHEAIDWLLVSDDLETVCLLAEMDTRAIRDSARRIAKEQLQYHKQRAKASAAIPGEKGRELKKLHTETVRLIRLALDFTSPPSKSELIQLMGGA